MNASQRAMASLRCVQAAPKLFQLDAKMIAEVVDPEGDSQAGMTQQGGCGLIEIGG